MPKKMLLLRGGGDKDKDKDRERERDRDKVYGLRFNANFSIFRLSSPTKLPLIIT